MLHQLWGVRSSDLFRCSHEHRNGRVCNIVRLDGSLLRGETPWDIGSLGFADLPAIISAAGDRASFRFIEFFTANIRNPNTRVSYGRAVREFCQWAEVHGFQLEALNPVIVAAYIELLGLPVDKHGRGYSKPSVKQHLAAIRMLFDYLMTGGVLRMNPASSVRGPKYSIKRGKTPVLTAGEARQLLDSIMPKDKDGNARDNE